MIARIREMLRAALDGKAVESEMDWEMRLHIEMETEENVRRGMSSAEARRAALVAFGGIEKAKEGTRDERSTRWLEELVADLQMTVRGMRKNVAFSVAVVALLALGTGANTAIFSLVNQLMLNPLPFPGGDRMYGLRVTANNRQVLLPGELAFADRWKARSTLAEDFMVSAFVSGRIGDTLKVPAPRELQGAMLRPGAMRFLGMRPMMGREIIAADTLVTAPPVLLLSERVWRTQFAADTGVVGSRVLLDGQTHVVIGVAPAAFRIPFGASNEVFTALRQTRGVDVIVRAKPGVTAAELDRELATLGPALSNDFGVPLDPPHVIAGGEDLNRNTKRLVLLLFGAVGFVLVIACANVANLVLSRTWSRQREFAIRRVLGAGRARLVRQILTESLFLSLIGGAAGLAVSFAFTKLLIAIQPATALLPTEVRTDKAVFLWTLGISTITGILFGLAPALFASGDRAGDVLKAGARSLSAGTGARRLRSSLVIAEVAVSVVLLIGAGLIFRTLVAMQRADVGMEPRGLTALDIRLPGSVFADPAMRRDVLTSITSRVLAIPGVSAVSHVLVPPPDFGEALTTVEVEGRAASPADTLTGTSFNSVAPGVFDVAGIRFVAGRAFVADPSLTDATKGSEVVINEEFARRYWPNGGALGARIRYTERWVTVVGIVRDVHVPGEPPRRSNFQFYQQLPAAPNRVALLIRSSIPPPLLEPQLRAGVREVNSRVRVRGFTDVDAKLVAGRAMHRFILALLGVFAALAIVLTAIGLHAVISYAVSQRRREIGIRVALGAPTSQIARLVFNQGLVLAGIGIVAGIAVAAGATRTMRGLLYGIAPGDPVTSIVVAVVLVLVSIFASGIPARRATRVDPVEMLRAE
jgi:predicted permease